MRILKNAPLKTILLTAIVTIGILCCVLYIAYLSRLDTEYLVLEAIHDDSSLAAFYVKTFRSSAEDIRSMQNETGLRFLYTREGLTDKHRKWVRYFIGKGYDLNSIGLDGETELHRAVYFWDCQVAEYLLSLGAAPSIKGVGVKDANAWIVGKTPLSSAI